MCVQCITEREGDNINMKTIQDHMKIIPKGFFLEKKIIWILYILSLASPAEALGEKSVSVKWWWVSKNSLLLFSLEQDRVSI